ncbi:hypothetical protein Zmor_012896 [Zophobas morio]|uniref:C2H2-type domain-containing protein n=1 Tax=Zophobas morio TaxID=2755281 RepID=A0AA38ICC3_9CUCU|nr:hypothetical protein Zmor_012896 [Zophobas morio]
MFSGFGLNGAKLGKGRRRVGLTGKSTRVKLLPGCNIKTTSPMDFFDQPDPKTGLFDCTRSEIDQYRCPLCPLFQTNCLACQSCPFTTHSQYLCSRHHQSLRHDLNPHETPEKLSWYTCPHCPFKTPNKPFLEIHLRIHSSDCLKCDSCDFKTYHELSLDQHRALEHAMWLVCSLCPFKTISSNRLALHERRRHSRRNLEWIVCSKCPFKTKLKSAMSKHTKIHESPNLFCKHCSFKTQFEDMLERHVARKHPKNVQLFACNQCDLKTKSKKWLRKHKSTQHGRKWFQNDKYRRFV